MTLTAHPLTGDAIIRQLELVPHPEGGALSPHL